MSDDDFFAEEEINLGHYEGGRNEREERHGYGKTIFPNGDRYEGNYDNGKRHGKVRLIPTDSKGLYKFANGSRYDGDYLWNHRDGHGAMIFPDGSRYDGNWSEDYRHGVGTYYYVNGDTYEGEWFQNKKNGRGVYTNEITKAKIEGTWQNGQLHGAVKIDFGSHSYDGSYKEDIISGPGKFAFPLIGVELTGKYHVTKEEEELIPEEGKPREEWVSKWKTRNMRPISLS